MLTFFCCVKNNHFVHALSVSLGYTPDWASSWIPSYTIVINYITIDLLIWSSDFHLPLPTWNHNALRRDKLHFELLQSELLPLAESGYCNYLGTWSTSLRLCLSHLWHSALQTNKTSFSFYIESFAFICTQTKERK